LDFQKSETVELHLMFFGWEVCDWVSFALCTGRDGRREVDVSFGGVGSFDGVGSFAKFDGFGSVGSLKKWTRCFVIEATLSVLRVSRGRLTITEWAQCAYSIYVHTRGIAASRDRLPIAIVESISGPMEYAH
jgi:hypothetical protein